MAAKHRPATPCTAPQRCHGFDITGMAGPASTPCFGKKMSMNFLGSRFMYDHEGHHDGKQVTRHWCRECGEIIAAWEFNLSIEENYCVAVTLPYPMEFRHRYPTNWQDFIKYVEGVLGRAGLFYKALNKVRSCTLLTVISHFTHLFAGLSCPSL